ncbi:hypothetical protein KI688_008360 [Linnemannia hyalina]|uniref:LAG1-DNAbind-domain-containing protein n=1 Tax=Linnemannia hyalina TaxID=64524 RepID=A0A9P7Y070_9FUNG|nr:hypothetical protein KI688_008360 [Linnemannia hyalina]
MKPPFPSAAQAYAKSIDSATASRHHPEARLTILPLPSLAALYPMDEPHHLLNHPSSAHHHHMDPTSTLTHPLSRSNPTQPSQQQQLNSQSRSHQQQQPGYQSYDSRYQKYPGSNPPSSEQQQSKSTAPFVAQIEQKFTSRETGARQGPEYMGTSMESLLNAIEVHSSSASSSSSRSPSPSSASTFHSVSPAPQSPQLGSATNNKARMSISNLLDDTPFENSRVPAMPAAPQQQKQQQQQRSPKVKAKSTSPTFSTIDINKRKWSNLSSANFEEERNAKIRRSIQAHVSGRPGSLSPKLSSMPSSASTDTQCGTVLSRQVFESKDPSTRYQMTTISCLHASVAQKSYGSEKRFLCPPPIVNIQAPHDGSNSALSSRPQVTMSVICETGDNNSALGQRSTLEDDRTGTFRYLYVTGTAKAKSFQLKLQVYDRACLPNGFVAAAAGPDAEEGVVNVADLPAPYAVFDSAPIAIISKPSKKTAKARNVSSCILAGSLVSLFNRINSQTVRTKYMSVQDGEFCAKNSTWSAFSITIVANGPCGLGRIGSLKSHHRQSPVQSSSPITYGAEIILTETETGIQTDRLIVCKVENGRIQQNATGPICQMQKVALMSTERNEDGEHVYLSAVGNDHQVGRYMDHSTTTKTLLNYQASTMIGGNPDFLKPGGDDFLCWTIVGISKFEYTYFESLPTASENETPYPITPFPTLMKNPVYNAASHTLELVVSNFHAPAGAKQQDQAPMDVWLGSRGPLKTQIIRRTTLNECSTVEGGSGGAHVDQTTLLVDLPQGNQMGVSPEEKSISLPLLFVRQTDGITYNSRAKVVFTCPDDSERWTVSMA